MAKPKKTVAKRLTPAEKVRMIIAQNIHLKGLSKIIHEITLGAMLIKGKRVAVVDVHLSATDNEKTIPDKLTGKINGRSVSIPVRKIVHKDIPRVSAAIGDTITTGENYAGTLGGFIQDTLTKQKYALTCCHVITTGQYVNYENPTAIKGTTVQNATTKDAVGNKVMGLMNNQYDLAWIALLNPDTVQPSGLKPYREMTDDDLIKPTKVKFKGMQTPNAVGEIANIGCSFTVGYDGQDVPMTNLIFIGKPLDANTYSAISTKGDSGSMVLTEDNEPIGIVVGENMNYTFVMPLGAFLTSNNKVVY